MLCQTATACARLFVDEGAFIGERPEPGKLTLSAYRNEAVYQEIASPSFRFTGLVAFQKRNRSILRRFRFPTSGILDAWQDVFDRWARLSKDVSTATSDGVDDNLLSEWRNCSGFLASLGEVCTSEHAASLEEPLGGMAWIDAVSSDRHEEPMLSRFLRLGVQLLGCSNVKVREAMRDVLSTDVSAVLSPMLFGALQSELDVLLGGALESAESNQEGEIIFAEQAAALLKTMVEKLESTPGTGSSTSVHLGALTLGFAKFLDGTAATPATLRVKIKICQLCCAVTKRKELLNLRDDVRIRNQLLEHIFGWIARPFAPKQEQFNAVARQDDKRRLQRDLDRECLKTLADLTFRLPLQPSDTQTDAGMSDVKSQMFHTYFNRFLSLLSFADQDKGWADSSLGVTIREDVGSNADLVITVLSNLLSANIDVGLKHSLNIGYHENVEIRAAFVRVLCNILTQGTEFSALTDSAVSDKYEELLNVSFYLPSNTY